MLLSAIQPDAKLRFIENPQKIETDFVHNKEEDYSQLFLQNNLDMFTCNFE